MKLYCGRKSHKTSPHHTRTHDAQKHSSSNAQKTQHQRNGARPPACDTREHIEEVWQVDQENQDASSKPGLSLREFATRAIPASCLHPAGTVGLARCPLLARGALHARRGGGAGRQPARPLSPHRAAPPRTRGSRRARRPAILILIIIIARASYPRRRPRLTPPPPGLRDPSRWPARAPRPPVPGRPKRGGPQARSRRHGNAQL
jgi:hypothetical protein